MELLSAIGHFFTFWLNISSEYDRIKSNEEKREKSVRMGVRSIIQTITCSILAVLSIIGAVFLFNNATSGGHLPIFSLIGGLACVGVALSTLVQGVVGGLLYMIYQFKLNKRGIRYAALVVWLVMVCAIIIGAAVGIVYLKK